MKICTECNKTTSGWCDKHLPEGFCVARQTKMPEPKDSIPSALEGIIDKYASELGGEDCNHSYRGLKDTLRSFVKELEEVIVPKEKEIKEDDNGYSFAIENNKAIGYNQALKEIKDKFK
jgi:hypothetical protein